MAFDPLSLQVRVVAPTQKMVDDVVKQINNMLNSADPKLKIGVDGTGLNELKNAKTQLENISNEISVIQKKMSELGKNNVGTSDFTQLNEIATKVCKSLESIGKTLKDVGLDKFSNEIKTAVTSINNLADALGVLDSKFAKTLGKSIGKEIARGLKENVSATKKEVDQMAESTAKAEKGLMGLTGALGAMHKEESKAGKAFEFLPTSVTSWEQAGKVIQVVGGYIRDIKSQLASADKLGFDTGKLRVFLQYFEQIQQIMQDVRRGQGYANFSNTGWVDTRLAKAYSDYAGVETAFKQEIASVKTMQAEMERLIELRSRLNSISGVTYSEADAARMNAMRAGIEELITKLQQMPRTEASSFLNQAYQQQVSGYEKTLNSIAQGEKVVAENATQAEKAIMDIANAIKYLESLQGKAKAVKGFDESKLSSSNDLIAKLKETQEYLERIKYTGAEVGKFLKSADFASPLKSTRGEADNLNSLIRQQIEYNRQKREGAQIDAETANAMKRLNEALRDLRQKRAEAGALGLDTTRLNDAIEKVKQFRNELKSSGEQLNRAGMTSVMEGVATALDKATISIREEKKALAEKNQSEKEDLQNKRERMKAANQLTDALEKLRKAQADASSAGLKSGTNSYYLNIIKELKDFQTLVSGMSGKTTPDQLALGDLLTRASAATKQLTNDTNEFIEKQKEAQRQAKALSDEIERRLKMSSNISTMQNSIDLALGGAHQNADTSALSTAKQDLEDFKRSIQDIGNDASMSRFVELMNNARMAIQNCKAETKDLEKADREAAKASAQSSKQANDEAKARANAVAQLIKRIKELRDMEARVSKTQVAQDDPSRLQHLRDLISAMEQYKKVLESMSSGMPDKNILASLEGSIPGVRREVTQLEQDQRRLDNAQAKSAQSAAKMSEEQRRLSSAIAQTSQSASRQSQVLSDLKSMAAQYVSIWGASNFIKEVAQVTGELELQRKSLEVIIGSAEKAGELYGEIRNLSQQSPYTFQDLIKSTRQLAAFGVQTKDLYSTMKSLSDIGAGLSVDVSRLILAFGHTKSYGYLSGIQNRQFETAGIDLVGALADRYNRLAREAAGADAAIKKVTRKDVFKMIHDKEVSFEDVNAVIMDLDKPGGKFYNMQERQFETLGGKLRNLRNNYNIMLSEIGEDHKGMLMGGVEMINSVTAGWERWAAVLKGVLIPLGAVKLANMAVGQTFTKQQQAIVANMKTWGQQQAQASKAVALLNSGKNNPFSYFGAGISPNKSGVTFGRADRVAFADTLKKEMAAGRLSKDGLLRLGFNSGLDKDLRRIALGLANVNNNMKNVILNGNILQKSMLRLRLAMFNAGGAANLMGVGLGKMFAGIGSFFLSNAPMLAIMALTASIFDFRRQMEEAEQTARRFGEQGDQDKKELSRLLDTYNERKEVTIERSGERYSEGGYRRTYNSITVDKEALRKIDISDDIEELKQKLQGLSPIFDYDLINIEKMDDQADQFEALLNKIEMLRQNAEAKEASTQWMEGMLKNTGAFWGDTLLENMQDWVNTINTAKAHVLDLDNGEIGRLNNTVSWIGKDNKIQKGYLDYIQDQYKLGSQQDALTKLIELYGDGEDGINRMRDSMEKFLELGNSSIGVQSLRRDFEDLEDIVNNNRFFRSETVDQWKEIMKDMPTVAKMTAQQMKDLFTDENGDFSGNIDQATHFAYSMKDNLLAGVKGMGENERQVLTDLFLDSLCESIGDASVAQAIRDAFQVGLVDSAIIEKALKEAGINGEGEVTADQMANAKNILTQLFNDKVSDDPEFARRLKGDAEGVLNQFLTSLENEAKKLSVKQPWKRALLELTPPEKDNQILINVQARFKAQIKGIDDVDKAIEAGKKKFKELKDKIESRKETIEQNVGFHFNLETFWSTTSNIDQLIEKTAQKVIKLRAKEIAQTITPAESTILDSLKNLLDELYEMKTWIDQFEKIGVNPGQNQQEKAKKKEAAEEARRKAAEERARKAEERKKKAEEVKKRKEEAERKRKEAEEARKQHKAESQADQAERNRQKALNDLLSSRLSLIKEMTDEYDELRKTMSDKAAWERVRENFRPWLSEGLITERDINSFTNPYELYSEIASTAKREYDATIGKKFYGGGEATNEQARNLYLQAVKASQNQAKQDRREASNDIVSNYKNTIDDIRRKWDLYFTILDETADYALAQELAGINRLPGAKGKGQGWQANENMSESLMWQAIMMLDNARSNAVGHQVKLRNPNDIDFSSIISMSEEELKDYVRNELLDFEHQAGLEQFEDNYTNYMNALTDALLDFIKQVKKEQDESIKAISKTIGESNTLQKQIDQLTKDYKERRIQINGNKDVKDQVTAEQRRNAVKDLVHVMMRDRNVQEAPALLSALFGLEDEYNKEGTSEARKREIEKELTDTIGDYMVDGVLTPQAKNIASIFQQTNSTTDRANAINDARYAWGIAQLEPQMREVMNSWQTLSKESVEKLAPIIRDKFEQAFLGEQISGEQLGERLKSLADIIYNNSRRTGNDGLAIWDRIRNPWFNPQKEGNRDLLNNWLVNLGVRRDLARGKGDKDLEVVLKRLIELLEKIIGGTATKQDYKDASELGSAVAGWDTADNDTKKKARATAEKKEDGTGRKRLFDIIKEFEPELEEAMETLLDALEKISSGLQFATDFFDSLGMEGMANATGDVNTVLGGAIGGASALSSLGPYGMAAGAALGVISGLAKAGDARRERQIQKLREDVQKIDNTLNLIKNLREKTLGYDTGARRRQLYNQYTGQGRLVTVPSIFGSKQQEVFVGSASATAMSEYYSRGGLSGSGYIQEYEALKKQREDYLQMYDKENGKKKKSQESLEEYRTKVAELDIQIMEFAQTLANELWSIDLQGWASQIGDALMTAFENGTSAASAFRDAVQDIMRSVVKSMMIKGIIEPIFADLQEKLFGENGVFDINNPEASIGKTIEVISDFFQNEGQTAINAAQEFYNGANDAIKQTLGYGMDSKDSSKNLTSAITSTASEETMGVVAGYLSRTSQDVAVLRIIQTGFVNESWPNYMEMITSANDSISAIDRNTEHIMTMMRDGQGALYERVERMSRRIDNFATGIDKCHTA